MTEIDELELLKEVKNSLEELGVVGDEAVDFLFRLGERLPVVFEFSVSGT